MYSIRNHVMFSLAVPFYVFALPWNSVVPLNIFRQDQFVRTLPLSLFLPKAC